MRLRQRRNASYSLSCSNRSSSLLPLNCQSCGRKVLALPCNCFFTVCRVVTSRVVTSVWRGFPNDVRTLSLPVFHLALLILMMLPTLSDSFQLQTSQPAMYSTKPDAARQAKLHDLLRMKMLHLTGQTEVPSNLRSTENVMVPPNMLQLYEELRHHQDDVNVEKPFDLVHSVHPEEPAMHSHEVLPFLLDKLAPATQQCQRLHHATLTLTVRPPVQFLTPLLQADDSISSVTLRVTVFEWFSTRMDYVQAMDIIFTRYRNTLTRNSTSRWSFDDAIRTLDIDVTHPVLRWLNLQRKAADSNAGNSGHRRHGRLTMRVELISSDVGSRASTLLVPDDVFYLHNGDSRSPTQTSPVLMLYQATCELAANVWPADFNPARSDANFNRITFRSVESQPSHRRTRRAATTSVNANRRRRSNRQHCDKGSYRAEFPKRCRGYEWKKKPCRRRALYVDFKEVGWSDWILAPPGFEAYYCAGSCKFPIGTYRRTGEPSNHAVVQSILSYMHPDGSYNSVPAPCCVPSKLSSTTLLFQNPDNTTIVRIYKNMVVDQCSCA